MIVRAAEVADLADALAIADRRRQQYAKYQPQFWNPAADAVEKQRAYFAALLDEPGTLFAVAVTDDQVQGFIIATVAPAPPVYSPGGPTCVVDDFAVAEDESWITVGPLLLHRVRSWAADRGAVQLVLVTAAADDPKRAALRTADLSVASEWWVGVVQPRPQHGC